MRLQGSSLSNIGQRVSRVWKSFGNSRRPNTIRYVTAESIPRYRNQDQDQLGTIGEDSLSEKSNLLVKNLKQYLPFDNFSSSIYSVPVLLFLRLFYQATPYDTKILKQVSGSSTKVMTATHEVMKLGRFTSDLMAEDILDVYAKTDVTEFLENMSKYPGISTSYQVRTMTWVKALASPLSHEYLQVLVEHLDTGKRKRIIVERSDWGDTLTVGWNWSSPGYASHHHVLPLPLLTASFTAGHGPNLDQFCRTLSETSKIRPYKLLREMCWWYAEKVFITTAQSYSHAVVKQWPYAHLRYSFVVRTEWIRRPQLVAAAEAFRISNRCEMLY